MIKLYIKIIKYKTILRHFKYVKQLKNNICIFFILCYKK